jgi:hypothetical protein
MALIYAMVEEAANYRGRACDTSSAMFEQQINTPFIIRKRSSTLFLKTVFRATTLALALSPSVLAQSSQPVQNSSPQSENFIGRWLDRVTATQAQQPNWAVPVFSPYPMLIQVFRADFDRQITSAGTTWNYGSSKGLNLIPFKNTEIDIYYPPYLQHNSAKSIDGFGDMSFVGKYRILAGNNEHGNYMLSALVITTIPTGSHSNGSTDATVNPTLAGGKGFGKFDVQTTLGATLPTGDTTKLGRPVLWNATAQYHLSKYLWPELESNETLYHGGANDGKKQEFLTPGLIFSKYKLRPHDPKSRLGVAGGAGMQIATSSFHTYNHQLVLTTRFLF